jgi:hypothetical protein
VTGTQRRRWLATRRTRLLTMVVATALLAGIGAVAAGQLRADGAWETVEPALSVDGDAVLRDDVVVIDPHRGLLDLSPDGSVLVFRADTPRIGELTEGTVVLIPRVVVRQVAAVERDGDRVIVATGDAALTEIFSEVDIRWDAMPDSRAVLVSPNEDGRHGVGISWPTPADAEAEGDAGAEDGAAGGAPGADTAVGPVAGMDPRSELVEAVSRQVGAAVAANLPVLLDPRAALVPPEGQAGGDPLSAQSPAGTTRDPLLDPPCGGSPIEIKVDASVAEVDFVSVDIVLKHWLNCPAIEFIADISADGGSTVFGDASFEMNASFRGRLWLGRTSGEMVVRDGVVEVSSAAAAMRFDAGLYLDSKGREVAKFKIGWDLIKVDVPFLLLDVPFLLRLGTGVHLETRYTSKQDIFSGKLIGMHCEGVTAFTLMREVVSAVKDHCATDYADIATFFSLAPSAVLAVTGVKIGVGPGISVKKKGTLFYGPVLKRTVTVGVTESGRLGAPLLDCRKILVDSQLTVTWESEIKAGRVRLPSLPAPVYPVDKYQREWEVGPRCPAGSTGEVTP